MQQPPILQTKLYIPPIRPRLVSRPRLIERLNQGLYRKLTLVSAPAGFGKTTLVSEWLAACGRPAAWLSLDERDSDPTHFLIYFVAALQTLALSTDRTGDANGPEPSQEPATKIGQGVLSALQTPQPPPAEAILTLLINEITAIPDHLILVLDDYHEVESSVVDEALTFLLDNLPPRMHLVIATRENPQLPLARLRAGGQLTELRATDLRFSPAEAAEFLNQAMGLNLAAEEIDALENRTEGWIAGLQLAALALQGTISTQRHKDAASFIKSFTGSHHYVLDYLVEEVLHQQPESVQAFLLRTSILERFCGPLCAAVVGKLLTTDRGTATEAEASDNLQSQQILEYLDRANLFIVPLDSERRWYRYQHLFRDLLRQRLQQSIASSTGDGESDVAARLAELHIRASQWYEANGLALEAFHHAAAADDIERAQRLISSGGLPLNSRDGVTPVLNWLATLPTTVLDARPKLWATWAALLLVTGHTTGVEEKLQAAEAGIAAAAAAEAGIAAAAAAEAGIAAAAAAETGIAAAAVVEAGNAAAETGLQGIELDDDTRNLIGQIAAARSTLALTQYQVEEIIAQSRRALAYLHPDNLTFRTTAIWTMGVAHTLRGDRAEAGQAFAEAMALSQASGDNFHMILAIVGLAEVQEADNYLYQAAETYQRALQLFGAQPLPNACEAHLGLARIHYQWNDLEAARRHGERSVELARQYESVIDRFVICEVFLARLKLAQGDLAGAAAMLADAGQDVRRHGWVHRVPEIAAAQVLALVRQGRLEAATDLAETHELPRSLARVRLAQGDPSAALAILDPLRQQMEAKGWQDERLKVMVLQAVAQHARAVAHEADDAKAEALQLLDDALALAEPGGYIRVFVDEGLPMAQLLSEARKRGIRPGYTHKLLAAFEAEKQRTASGSAVSTSFPVQPLIEPLSQRELEVLELVAQGLSNREIGERLFLALDTVKGHNRRIYAKLQVQRRTEAVARARELGLL